MRLLSQFVRNLKAINERSAVLSRFSRWKNALTILPAYRQQEKKLLIIRLDDIGDYLLFRNFLIGYNLSSRWKGYQLTLLGNISWKPLFEKWDGGTVDKAIWVDKRKYFQNATYRFLLWQEIRQQGFEAVICPSRSRPLLLDDIFTLATGAVHSFGNENSLSHTVWNNLSDKLYRNIFHLKDPFCHEFEYNRQFASWSGALVFADNAPAVPVEKYIPSEKFILCFIGASGRSKRWPAARWIELINQINELSGYRVYVAGGADEMEQAGMIADVTKVINIAGKKSLTDLADIMAGASLVISNDTMAAHMGVCCNIPVIILANGNNYFRFSDYSALNTSKVNTIYPHRFVKWYRNNKIGNRHYDNISSSDISTISAAEVMNCAMKLIS